MPETSYRSAINQVQMLHLIVPLRFRQLPVLFVFLILLPLSMAPAAGASPDGMDPTVDPGDDFFRYANGAWIDQHPVPADLRMYTAVNEISDRVEERVQTLIEEAAANESAPEGSAQWLIGRFYRTAMDTEKSDTAGLDPVKPYLTRIEESGGRDEIRNASVDLLAGGMTPFFTLYSGEDPGDKGMLVATISQSGLSFPSRDFYFSEDPEIASIREQFREYAVRLFTLAGYPQEEAQAHADAAIRIESLLAEASADASGYGRAEQMYYRVDQENLTSGFPGIPWEGILEKTGRPDLPYINIHQPEYLREVGRILNEEPVGDIQSFLLWKVLQFAAPLASTPYRDAYSRFYEVTLAGQEESTPWWRQVLAMMNEVLGNAIGKAYVEKYFPESDREEAAALIDNLHASQGSRLSNLSWLTNETRETALGKHGAMRLQVGYPDTWGDYLGLNVTEDSYLENILNISRYYFTRSMLVAGYPSDPDTWYLSPQTVNAYYDSTRNSIVIPAGILQEPFFNSTADPAVNYGAIGSMIGHEMTHGFDEMGRKYDKNGTLNNWWTRADLEGYAIHAFPLVPEFSRTEVLPGLYMNGTRTISENVADLGGLTVAYHAYIDAYPDEADTIGPDGLTGKQRFFIGFAQAWRGTIRDEELRNLILVENHPWNTYRVNIIPFNMDEFYEAFPGIGTDDDLFIPYENRSRLW